MNHGLFKVIFLEKNKKLSPEKLFEKLNIDPLKFQLPDYYYRWQEVNELKKKKYAL